MSWLASSPTLRAGAGCDSIHWLIMSATCEKPFAIAIWDTDTPLPSTRGSAPASSSCRVTSTRPRCAA